MSPADDRAARELLGLRTATDKFPVPGSVQQSQTYSPGPNGGTSNPGRVSFDTLRGLVGAAGYAPNEETGGSSQDSQRTLPPSDASSVDLDFYARDNNFQLLGNPYRFECHSDVIRRGFCSRKVPECDYDVDEHGQAKGLYYFGKIPGGLPGWEGQTENGLVVPDSRVYCVQGPMQKPARQHRLYVTNFSASVPGLLMDFSDEEGPLYPKPFTREFIEERLLSLARLGMLDHCHTVNDLQAAFLNSLEAKDLGENRLLKSETVRNLYSVLAAMFNSEGNAERFDLICKIMFDAYESVDVPARDEERAKEIIGSIAGLQFVIVPEISDHGKLHFNISQNVWMSGFSGFVKANPTRLKDYFSQIWPSIHPGVAQPVVVFSFGRRDGDTLVHRAQTVDSLEYLKSHPNAKSKFSKGALSTFASVLTAQDEALLDKNSTSTTLLVEKLAEFGVEIETAAYFPNGNDPHLNLMYQRGTPAAPRATPAPAPSSTPLNKRTYNQMQGRGNPSNGRGFYANFRGSTSKRGRFM